MAVNRDILFKIMERRLKDQRLLALLRTIVNSGAGLYDEPLIRDWLGLKGDYPPPRSGLPIGNLTSQWWGNHYLAELDSWIKRELKIPHAQRYMDDLTLFSDQAPVLKAARKAINDWLWDRRQLRLKDPGAAVRSCRHRFSYLGHEVDRQRIQVGPRARKTARSRLTEHLIHGDSLAFERALISYRGILLGPVKIDGKDS